MFQRKIRRFRHRSNGRGHQRSANGGGRTRIGSNSFLNDDRRNNFRPVQSAEKLLERYNVLAKEALSSGDKILSENYLQHADHFARIIEMKNSYHNQNKTQSTEEPKISNENNNKENISILSMQVTNKHESNLKFDKMGNYESNIIIIIINQLI